MSLGGLFVETRTPRVVGAAALIDFLVEEGSVQAEAVVRRVDPERGLALKFTTVRVRDRVLLRTLMNRYRQSKPAEGELLED